VEGRSLQRDWDWDSRGRGVADYSGHLLYYSGDEAVRQAASYSHLGAGIGLPVLLGLHLWRRALV